MPCLDSTANRNSGYLVIEVSRKYLVSKLNQKPIHPVAGPKTWASGGVQASSITSGAFVLGLLRDGPRTPQLRVNGTLAHVIPFPEATLCLIDLALDLEARPTADTDRAECHLPLAAFDQVNDSFDAHRLFDPQLGHASGEHDHMLSALKSCLSDLVARADHLSNPLLDHLVAAVHAHMAFNYTSAKVEPTTQGNGLVPWQLRRAKELIVARLGEEVDLDEVAAACRLSRSHFGRAFRRSTGRPPHRWIMERRVEMAKGLLAESRMPLAELAVACGFTDQSHLSRVFLQMEGETPGAWRRLHEDPIRTPLLPIRGNPGRAPTESRL
jgi:AraC family transcriptional regulator